MDRKTFILAVIIILVSGIASAAYNTYRHSSFTIGDGKDIDLNGQAIGNGTIRNQTITNDIGGANITNATDISGKNIGGVVYADQYTSIQEAITIATSGQEVYISAGNYTLASPISIAGKSNIRIRGAGINSTNILRYGFIKNDVVRTDNVEISDLTINLMQTAGQNAINLNGNSYNFYLHDLRLENGSNEFLLDWQATSNLVVERSYFKNAGSKDLAAGTQLFDNNSATFRNNVFENTLSTASAALTTGSTGNLLIDGNTFRDSPMALYSAVSIETSFGEAGDIIIVNNKGYGGTMKYSVGISATYDVNRAIIQNNIGNGIVVGNSKYANIANNIISNGSYGITLALSNDSIISNNQISRTDYFGATGVDKAGIYLDTVRNITVEGNHIFENVGVYHLATNLATDITFQNNKILGAAIAYTAATPVRNTIRDNFGMSPFNFGNSAAAPTAFGAGDTYFDTDISKLCYYSNSWKQVDDSTTACT